MKTTNKTNKQKNKKKEKSDLNTLPENLAEERGQGTFQDQVLK